MMKQKRMQKDLHMLIDVLLRRKGRFQSIESYKKAIHTKPISNLKKG